MQSNEIIALPLLKKVKKENYDSTIHPPTS